MFFDRGFSTLAELKNRLGITDTQDDTVLTEILRSTAYTIEGVAGRSLRRRHSQSEVLSGGSRTIRVSVSPVVQVHSIRESATRDFSVAANYTELTEGTDYILEAGAGTTRPGESGVIRRIDQNWKGDEFDKAGQIQIVYTGGFKTDDEVALEDSTLTINSATDLDDFSLRNLGPTIEERAGQFVSSKNLTIGPFRSFFRFDVEGKLFSTWQIVSLTLDLYMSKSATSIGDAECNVWVSSLDANVAAIQDLYDDVEGSAVKIGFLTTLTSTTPSKQTFLSSQPLSALGLAVDAAIRDSHLTFIVSMDDLSVEGDIVETRSIEDSTSSQRPLMTVVHRPLPADVFITPGDLRHANLLQASHEFQTRKSPGMIAAAQRGTTIASGASFLKTVAQVLPEVERIAMSYRRLY